MTSIFKKMTVQYCQVIIAKCRCMEMTQGVVHALGCSIYGMQLRPTTSAEQFQMQVPSPTVHNVNLLNQMSASHDTTCI